MHVQFYGEAFQARTKRKKWTLSRLAPFKKKHKSLKATLAIELKLLEEATTLKTLNSNALRNEQDEEKRKGLEEEGFQLNVRLGSCQTIVGRLQDALKKWEEALPFPEYKLK